MGQVIADLGVLTNGWFYWRCRQLNRIQPNPILSAQSKLYRAKTLVDSYAVTALTAILLFSCSDLDFYMDIGGSIAIALYLLVNGLVILTKSRSGQYSWVAQVGRL